MSTSYVKATFAPDSTPLAVAEGEVVVVNTPSNSRTYPTWEAAQASAEAGVPTLKRGWTVAWETAEGYPHRRYLRVRNSKGRFVTGAVALTRTAAKEA